MAKKKEKKQIINNIQELNLEIDYDKLGETIKKSISQNGEEETVDKSKLQKATLIDWIRLIGLIISNKAKTNGKITPIVLSMIVEFFFNCLAMLLAFLGISLVVISITGVVDLIISAELFTIKILGVIGSFVIGIASLMFALILRASANEFDKEKDRNYIISVFSGIVSFAALIVALIALIKGVG